jgi:hypothetical protein
MNEKNEEIYLNFEVEENNDFQNNEIEFFESSNGNCDNCIKCEDCIGCRRCTGDIFGGNILSPEENELPELYYWMTAQSTQEIYEKIDEPIKLENEPENKIFSKDVHSKENDDNIRRKIKCHFHNFIINFFNNLIKEKKKGNIKFKKIKYSYALNDTIKFNKILLLSKISDFFKLEISNKYKKYQKNENELVYEKLIKRFDKDVLQLFNLTYMEFYEKYYLNEAFNNNSKLKNFYSLFKKERNKESDENKIRYSNLLKLIAEQRFINYYLPNRLFMTQKFFSNI